jgi:hypothetical protein
MKILLALELDKSMASKQRPNLPTGSFQAEGGQTWHFCDNGSGRTGPAGMGCLRPGNRRHAKLKRFFSQRAFDAIDDPLPLSEATDDA